MTKNINEPIVVDIKSPQGNAFYILALFRQYLKDSKVYNKKIDKLLKDAKSGNYNHLLKVVGDNSNIIFME